jgi:hypothetical protein
MTAGTFSRRYSKNSFFGQVELLQNSVNQETRRASGKVECVSLRKVCAEIVCAEIVCAEIAVGSVPRRGGLTTAGTPPQYRTTS